MSEKKKNIKIDIEELRKGPLKKDKGSHKSDGSHIIGENVHRHFGEIDRVKPSDKDKDKK